MLPKNYCRRSIAKQVLSKKYGLSYTVILVAMIGIQRNHMSLAREELPHSTIIDNNGMAGQCDEWSLFFSKRECVCLLTPLAFRSNASPIAVWRCFVVKNWKHKKHLHCILNDLTSLGKDNLKILYRFVAITDVKKFWFREIQKYVLRL